MAKSGSRSKVVAAIGLMSGTSADGVDAAIICTDGQAHVEFCGGLTLPYPAELRQRLIEASQHDVRTVELLRLERDITVHHAEAVAALREEHAKAAASASIVGFHGHTIRHLPGEGITFQIGNAWLLSEKTGLPVVFDFRRRDMVIGGQGAPLVAMFHRALFAGESRPVVILNLGGVANITWLGSKGEIIAGDTGPGCGLLDEWVEEMADLPHDADGKLALRGQVHWDLVEEALAVPFFRKPLPRSADRFEFDHVDVSGLSVEDGAATLCAVTVEAVVRAVATMPEQPAEVWVTGGGVHHPVIMKLLADKLNRVQNIKQRGFNPDTLEAECFAWLAVRHQLGLPITIPETTRCREASRGGVLVL